MLSHGPGIATLPSVYEDQYTYGGFTEIRPRVIDYADGVRDTLRTLEVIKKIPEPTSVSFNNPPLIDFLQSTPQQEPVLAFRSFIQGVACAAAMVPVDQHPSIQQALDKLAENVSVRQILPPIDSDFSDRLLRVEAAIFTNGEVMSWKNLISFAWGAFWLLTFVKSPNKKKGNYSPESFIEALCTNAAQLGFPPGS